jgi:hypothetical protein
MNFQKLTLTFLLAAASCFAADVDGNWAGTLSTPGGDFPATFTFKADGTTLTGTTAGPDGDVKIADGKVDGDKLSFTVSFDFGGMPLTMAYKGVLARDEIKFTIDILGMAMEATVKKVTGAAAAVAASAPASTAVIDGKWSGTLVAPQGSYPVTLTFKAEGATLTGSSNGPIGVNPVVNGKVDRNNVTFTVTIDYNGMPLVMSYKGVMAKDEIKFAIEVAGMPFEMVVKKAA